MNPDSMAEDASTRAGPGMGPGSVPPPPGVSVVSGVTGVSGVSGVSEHYMNQLMDPDNTQAVHSLLAMSEARTLGDPPPIHRYLPSAESLYPRKDQFPSHVPRQDYFYEDSHKVDQSTLVGANVPTIPSMTNMSSMPNMTSLPSMSSMSTMPSMSSIQSIPSVTSIPSVSSIPSVTTIPNIPIIPRSDTTVINRHEGKMDERDYHTSYDYTGIKTSEHKVISSRPEDEMQVQPQDRSSETPTTREDHNVEQKFSLPEFENRPSMGYSGSGQPENRPFIPSNFPMVSEPQSHMTLSSTISETYDAFSKSLQSEQLRYKETVVNMQPERKPSPIEDDQAEPDKQVEQKPSLSEDEPAEAKKPSDRKPSVSDESEPEPEPEIKTPVKSAEKSKDTFECSFTESDESDDGDQDKSKKNDDDYFRITFDSDDDGKSENGEFLTCSVCGKELPETAVAEAGKEMCNTCKLVQAPVEAPKKRGRKKIYNTVTKLPIIKTPIVSTLAKPSLEPKVVVPEPCGSTFTPLRKSTRKRFSTIVVEESIHDSDEDLGTFDDSDHDVDYPHIPKKKYTEKKEAKGSSGEDFLKSKYAQELNLAPVVKTDPDGKEVTTEQDGSAMADIVSDVMKLGVIKRKKGRPKGSKNKPKVSRDIASLISASKRDMKFNKRWVRARGPVPEANPDTTDGMWTCEFCGKSFPIRRNFLAHRRKHSGRHKCEECGETFECNSKLQRHIRRHRGEKPFACHLCPKAYSENMWLQRHLATHLAEGHAPQPKPYQCNICGRQYTHKGTMIYHVKTHTETKFYQCDVCGKQFTHRSSLECHIKTHTGEKPFVCEICGKRFADRSVQLRHTRSHSGEKPYKCTICDKGFTQSGTLNIHMRMHTSEKPYKCKVCDMGFMKRMDLTKHSKTHVGEMLTKQENLITCRVNDRRGVDIQKRATQILIDAYGEKKADGTIEIRTRPIEPPVESDNEEMTERTTSEQVSNIVKAMEHPPLDPRAVESYMMGRGESHLLDHTIHHEEIQRRAMEYILMKRHELEQQELERFHQQQQQPHGERSHIEPLPTERHNIDHHTVGAEQHQAERLVEQQISRHVEQNAGHDRHLVDPQIGRHVEQSSAHERQIIDQHINRHVEQSAAHDRQIVEHQINRHVDQNAAHERQIVDQQISRHVEQSAAHDRQLVDQQLSRHVEQSAAHDRQMVEQQISRHVEQSAAHDRQMVDQQISRHVEQSAAHDRQIIDQQINRHVEQTVPHDRQMVEQQISRHVEQNAAQRRLLEQVERQVVEQDQQAPEHHHQSQHQSPLQQQQQHLGAESAPQVDTSRLAQMSPHQQALWMCKYN